MFAGLREKHRAGQCVIGVDGHLEGLVEILGPQDGKYRAENFFLSQSVARAELAEDRERHEMSALACMPAAS